MKCDQNKQLIILTTNTSRGSHCMKLKKRITWRFRPLLLDFVVVVAESFKSDSIFFNLSFSLSRFSRSASNVFLSSIKVEICEKKHWQQASISLVNIRNNKIFFFLSNLCKTWLLTGGRCSDVVLCFKNRKRDLKITVVVIDRWLLFGGVH